MCVCIYVSTYAYIYFSQNFCYMPTIKIGRQMACRLDIHFLRVFLSFWLYLYKRKLDIDLWLCDMTFNQVQAGHNGNLANNFKLVRKNILNCFFSLLFYLILIIYLFFASNKKRKENAITWRNKVAIYPNPFFYISLYIYSYISFLNITSIHLCIWKISHITSHHAIILNDIFSINKKDDF